MFRHFIVPIAFASAALFLSLFPRVFVVDYLSVLSLAPYIMLAAVIAVCYFLIQTETLYLAALFLAINLSTTMNLTLTDDPSYWQKFTLINLLWPLPILSSYRLRNSRVGSFPGLLNLLFISSVVWLPMVLAPVLLTNVPDLQFSPMFQPLYPGALLGIAHLLSYLLALVFMASLYYLWPTRNKAIWLTSLLLYAFAFAELDRFTAMPLVSLAIASMLTISLIRDAFDMAYIDELTRIPGRKALQKQLNSLGRRYSIAMLDVDHFKKFNDTHGHDVGDQVLMLVAAKIKQVKGGGRAYRYGGEEFTLVFPGKTPQQAEPFLEEVRQAIADYKMALRSKDRPKDNKTGKKQRAVTTTKTVSVTVSMGVAERQARQLPEQVIKAADNALYSAKKAGRNCIKLAP